MPGLLHAWYIVATYQDRTIEHYSTIDDDDRPGHGRGVTYYYVRSDTHAQHPYPHHLQNTGGTASGAGAGSFGGYGTIGVSSPAPVPSGAGGMGGQFPAQQLGKINPYAGGVAKGGIDGSRIPDGHLRVVVQSSGEDGLAAVDAASEDGGVHSPPSYTDAVKGDHKIQRD